MAVNTVLLVDSVIRNHGTTNQRTRNIKGTRRVGFKVLHLHLGVAVARYWHSNLCFPHDEFQS